MRFWLKIPASDTSHDDYINAAINITTSLVESYLDRRLAYDTDKELFTDVQGHTLSLRRYPIEDILTSEKDFHVIDKEKGLVHFNGIAVKGAIEIEYTGGYGDLYRMPEDLLLAMVNVFDSVYARISEGGGGGGGVAAGEISRVTLADLGTVTYTTGADADSGGSGIADSPLGASVFILDLYRRWQA